MLTQDAWTPVDRGGLVILIVEKSGIEIKSKLLLLLTFPTISMSHDIYKNCIKFDYHDFSWLVKLCLVIPLFLNIPIEKNKMKPTNPNAHTYVNGTDVKTHGYAVTHNIFLQ